MQMLHMSEKHAATAIFHRLGSVTSPDLPRLGAGRPLARHFHHRLPSRMIQCIQDENIEIACAVS